MLTPRTTSSDDFCFYIIGCNDCGKTVKALCKKHGELAKVKDRFIPSRAKLTTPHQVVVKTIELRAAGNHSKCIPLASRCYFGKVLRLSVAV